MVFNFNSYAKTKKGISRLTLTLVMLVITAAVLGVLAFVMKHSKDIELADLKSFDRLKRLFAGRKPVISADEAAKIKSIVSGGESGGLVVEPGSVNTPSRTTGLPGSPAGRGVKGDEIILRNGDVITGEIISEKLSLKTEHGLIGFRFADILAAYSVYETQKPYDKVISKNGDKVSGVIADAHIELKTAAGDVIKIAVPAIKIINKNIGTK
jgi:hypothetical protein